MTEDYRRSAKREYRILLGLGWLCAAFMVIMFVKAVTERNREGFVAGLWVGAFALLFLGGGRLGQRSYRRLHAEDERARARARDAAAAERVAAAAERVAAAAERAAYEAELRASKAAERERIRRARARRDADSQDVPYYYKVGRHANETLALRYGIANLDIRSEPDTAHVLQMLELGEDPPVFSKRRKSGEAGWIALRKIRKAGIQQRDGTEGPDRDAYLVELSHFRDREALAVIEPGTDYVKTYLPLKQSWFRESHALEEVLKGNATMPLQEIAKFHVATKLRRASPYSEPRERSGRRPSD